MNENNGLEKRPTHKASSRSEQKKQQILHIALECFVLHGVEGTTIDMIREATQTSVGSLYHHFGNKDAIASAVFIAGLRDFAQLLKQYLNELGQGDSMNEDQAHVGVKALVYANVDWISTQPQWANYVFQHRSRVKGVHENKLSGDMNHFNNFINNWFSPYIEQNLIQDLPQEVLASLVIGPVHTYARHWLAGRYEVSLKEHREVFAEAAWQAIKVA
ncbi:MAG: TetR/AcrR family transcriptional regulator [Bermanella sp.]